MEKFIKNIIIGIEQNESQRPWQEFFASLNIKGNESTKGERPVTQEQSDEIFLAVETCLKNVEEDKVKNTILDGIHNLTPYMAGNNVSSKYNALHDLYYVENYRN